MNYKDKRLLTIALGVGCLLLLAWILARGMLPISSGAGKLARLKPWPSIPPRAFPPALKADLGALCGKRRVSERLQLRNPHAS